MKKSNKIDIHQILLDAHKQGVEQAIDLSIRTGTPLIIEKNGKIIELQPKYKYVRVPIKNSSKKTSSLRKKIV